MATQRTARSLAAAVGGRGGESRLLRAEGAPREEGVTRRRAASVPRVVVLERHAQHGRLRNLRISRHPWRGLHFCRRQSPLQRSQPILLSGLYYQVRCLSCE